ncbi:hypothetical protein HanIR_Chr01g0029371 [Helianthus annuus]|nr:hypothetical protein HanIR_Chr01g0029371 [Helianthus annuus]
MAPGFKFPTQLPLSGFNFCSTSLPLFNRFSHPFYSPSIYFHLHHLRSRHHHNDASAQLQPRHLLFFLSKRSKPTASNNHHYTNARTTTTTTPPSHSSQTPLHTLSKNPNNHRCRHHSSHRLFLFSHTSRFSLLLSLSLNHRQFLIENLHHP